MEVGDIVKCNSTGAWTGALKDSPDFQIVDLDNTNGIAVALCSEIEEVGGVEYLNGRFWDNRLLEDLLLVNG